MSDECECRVGKETRTGFIEGNRFNARSVAYSIVDGQALFEGDIVLNPTTSPTAPTEPDLFGVIISGRRFRWPSGVVPFQIDAGLGNQQRVIDAIQHWHDNTGMIFVARNNDANFITFIAGNGCSSQVGMSGGNQAITLGNTCTKGNTIHEIGHAIGLWHEQSREDRLQHVRINIQNIEPDALHNFDQHISDGDDIGSYDFGSIMHYSATAFSSNGQPTIEPLGGQTIGQRLALSAGDIAAVNHMYFPITPTHIAPSVYTLRQKSSGRFLDAHEYAAKEFGVVTRTAQHNDTQRWIVRPVGLICTVKQRSNGRFVDAHEHSGQDFRVVTREAQNNDTQKWQIMFLGEGEYTIQQVSSGRFLDAYSDSGKDFSMVTRGATGSDTQKWLIRAAANSSFTIQQKSTMRFADAHEIAGRDFALVTRGAQNNATQEWLLTPTETICTIQQLSNRRYLDAHESAGRDFAAVTREPSQDDKQHWLMRPQGNDAFTLQQFNSRRYLDAHEIASRDFSVVTRDAQGNDTQVWMVDRITL